MSRRVSQSLRVRVSVQTCVCVRVRVCLAVPSAKHRFAHALRVHACATVARSPRRCAGAVEARRGPAVLIARLCVRGCGSAPFGRLSRASAAGITWTSRTTSALWAARYSHTSVVGAAGAIYVIGGSDAGGGTFYQDVWASTDGGARTDSMGGVVKEYNKKVLRGYYGDTTGVLRGY